MEKKKKKEMIQMASVRIEKYQGVLLKLLLYHPRDEQSKQCGWNTVISEMKNYTLVFDVILQRHVPISRFDTIIKM